MVTWSVQQTWADVKATTRIVQFSPDDNKGTVYYTDFDGVVQFGPTHHIENITHLAEKIDDWVLRDGAEIVIGWH